jgi:hypothetical protein
MITNPYDVEDSALETTPMHLNALDSRDENDFVKQTYNFMSSVTQTDSIPRNWTNLGHMNHELKVKQLKELSSKGRLANPNDNSDVFHRDVLGSAERWGVVSRPRGIAGMGPDTSAGVKNGMGPGTSASLKSRSKHLTLFLGGEQEMDNLVSDCPHPMPGDKIWAILLPERVDSNSNYVTHLRNGLDAVKMNSVNLISLDQTTQLSPGFIAIVYQWQYVVAGVVNGVRQSMTKMPLMEQTETTFKVRMPGTTAATPAPVVISEHYKVLFATVIDEATSRAGQFAGRNMFHPEIPMHRNYALQKAERHLLRVCVNSGCQGRDYANGHTIE